MNSLDERMKNYENVTRNYLTRRTPIIGRNDGRAFHNFTRNCTKPFDTFIMDSMEEAAIETAKEIQGFRIGYIQSDEFSWVAIDYLSLESEGWFDYNINKLVSISSSLFTANFNKSWKECGNLPHDPKFEKLAYFDARVFNIPREEVTNGLLFRALDWKRNSLQMYTRAFFSHKQCENKNQEDMHKMLYSIGRNWANDLSDREKNGTWLIKTESGIETRYDILPTFESINKIVDPLINPKEIE